MSRKNNNPGKKVSENWKVLLRNTILTALTTSLITTILSFSLWNWQFDKTKEQEKWDKKFGIFSRLTDDLAMHHTLLSAKLKFNLELHSRTKGIPFASIEEKRRIEDELEEYLPYEYEGLVEYDKNKPKLIGSFFIAEATFGDKTDKAILNYLNNIINKRPQEHIDTYLARLNKKEATINIQDLVDSIYIDADILRQNILEQMKNELGL